MGGLRFTGKEKAKAKVVRTKAEVNMLARPAKDQGKDPKARAKVSAREEISHILPTSPPTMIRQRRLINLPPLLLKLLSLHTKA